LADVTKNAQGPAIEALTGENPRGQECGRHTLTRKRDQGLAIYLYLQGFPAMSVFQPEKFNILFHRAPEGSCAGVLRSALPNRIHAKADKSMLGTPSAIHSLKSLPTTGPKQNPCPENPDATQKPGIPGTLSKIGMPSDVQVVIPAKARMICTPARNGKTSGK
jgi:hypothetical protein